MMIYVNVDINICIYHEKEFVFVELLYKQDSRHQHLPGGKKLAG